MKFCPNCGHNIAAQQAHVALKLLVNYCTKCGVCVRDFQNFDDDQDASAALGPAGARNVGSFNK